MKTTRVHTVIQNTKTNLKLFNERSEHNILLVGM